MNIVRFTSLDLDYYGSLLNKWQVIEMMTGLILNGSSPGLKWTDVISPLHIWFLDVFEYSQVT